uniref:Reverse transcriptase domain-containing protein n=1 Tax=Hordeum vulgare subsp. vulgare TaxID=112509 RepID=A0A8I7BGM6_HORVV
MGMSPYKMVYAKACHLPLELEHQAYWAIKEGNYDFKLAGEKRLFDISSLDEWRTQAYENANCLRKKLKECMTKKSKTVIQCRIPSSFVQFLFQFFVGKLLSKWEGPYVIEEVYHSGALKLNNFEGKKTKSAKWEKN